MVICYRMDVCWFNSNFIEIKFRSNKEVKEKRERKKEKKLKIFPLGVYVAISKKKASEESQEKAFYWARVKF